MTKQAVDYREMTACSLEVTVSCDFLDFFVCFSYNKSRKEEKTGRMIRQTESKKYRYEMRNEIEHIIKNQKIDRNLFHEVAKWNYERVIRKIYYSFCDYKKYPTIQVGYMWTRFRENLKSTELICTDWADWDLYISQIEKLLPKKKRSFFYYLLVDGGWVYEGTLECMQQVLKEYPIWMNDFYVIPKAKNISWMIVHCEDGACMCRVWN